MLAKMSDMFVLLIGQASCGYSSAKYTEFLQEPDISYVSISVPG